MVKKNEKYPITRQIMMHPQIYELMKRYQEEYDSEICISPFIAIIVKNYIKQPEKPATISPNDLGVPYFQRKSKRLPFRLRAEQFEEITVYSKKIGETFTYVIYQSILLYIMQKMNND